MDFNLKELIWGIGEVWKLVSSEFPVIKWIIIVLIVLVVLIIFRIIKFKQKKEKLVRTKRVIKRRMEEKKGWIAALLNLLVPGAGYIYLERLGKFVFALFSTILLLIIFLPAGVILWLVWIFVGYYSAVPEEVRKAKRKDEHEELMSELRKPVDKMTIIIAIIVVITVIVLACLGILK